MNDLLQIAIENLVIKDVYQRRLSAYCSPDFDPKFGAAHEMTVQLMHIVRSSEILEFDEGEEESVIFRVIIALGVRWLPASENDDEPMMDDDAEDLARIECRMVAEYALKSEIPQEALNEFAQRNASFHVWPYWREVVASQCAKMNLKPIMLPTVQFASNRDSDRPQTDHKNE